MSVAGIIFSNLHDKTISEITRQRTMASVPYGCRYRLIDFTLSNMVNSAITNVGIITHYNYQSLMDHLGAGKDWDLARRNGGIQILPPFITAFANNQNALYTTRLEALKSVNSFISNLSEEFVVMSDCDIICNIDLRDVIKYHIETNADVTFVGKKMMLTPENKKNCTIFKYDKENRLTEISEYTGKKQEEAAVNINIYVTRRRYLEDIINDSIAHGYNSFTKDIVAKNIGYADYRVYMYQDYFASISSMTDYYNHNMDLLDTVIRSALFNVRNRPIFTKVRNSAPSVYTDTAEVHNSLIADGCHIEGKVENSILFRGVTVGKNTHIKNSILMQDTFTGDNVQLNYVITDKNVVIREGINLSGHVTKPFYLSKNTFL